MSSADVDAVVLGGGVAGACAARRLALAGVTVLQLVLRQREAAQPAEVLSPGARRALLEDGLPEPPAGSTACEGVLSVWGEVTPDFGDYELMTGIPGLAVRRGDMHRAFEGACTAAGARIEACTRSSVAPSAPGGPAVVRWTKSDASGDAQVRAGNVLIASGRSAGLGLADAKHRVRVDRAVALWVPFAHRSHAAKLMIEAVSGGWWYVPPSVEGSSQLVLVTDAGDVPRGVADRAAWLERQFEETVLVQACAEQRPNFDAVAGTDAHFGLHQTLAWSRGARIGAAALALDPLSGSGIVRALEGARRAADDFLRHGFVGRDYVELMRSMAIEEAAFRRRTYTRAAARFPLSEFWRRRRAHADIEIAALDSLRQDGQALDLGRPIELTVQE